MYTVDMYSGHVQWTCVGLGVAPLPGHKGKSWALSLSQLASCLWARGRPVVRELRRAPPRASEAMAPMEDGALGHGKDPAASEKDGETAALAQPPGGAKAGAASAEAPAASTSAPADPPGLADAPILEQCAPPPAQTAPPATLAPLSEPPARAVAHGVGPWGVRAPPCCHSACSHPLTRPLRRAPPLRRLCSAALLPLRPIHSNAG